MIFKQVVSGVEAHKKVYSGLKELSETVGSTFGPNGHSVSLQKDDGHLHCTKDGVTVAREMTFSDQVEYCASTYIKDIANNTVSRAGDGTTTAILLAWELYKAGRSEEGEPLVKITPQFRNDLKEATTKAIDYLNSVALPSKDPETLEKVALIASNNDTEIASLLKEAIEVIGETGNIYVEPSKSTQTKLFTSPGMGIMKGFMSSYFINNPQRMNSELMYPFVLVTEDEIYSVFQLSNLAYQITNYHQKLRAEGEDLGGKLTDVPHLLIVCKKIKDDILEWVITQHLHRSLNICVIQADHLGDSPTALEDFMTDLRLITGCEGIGSKFTKRLGTGTQQANISDLGRLHKSIVTKDKSIFIPLPENAEKMREVSQGLRTQLESETDEELRSVIRHRISRLSDGVAILSVGGSTEKSVNERADRIEDAVCAVMVAREHGALPGGGMPYLMAAKHLFGEEVSRGNMFLIAALENVVRQLFKTNHADELFQDCICDGVRANCGKDPKVWIGANLRTGKGNICLYEEGILEPVKVVIEAIQNATDIISMLLNTEKFVIYADNQDKKFIYPVEPRNPFLGGGLMMGNGNVPSMNMMGY
jgi:chaperonin GroEL